MNDPWTAILETLKTPQTLAMLFALVGDRDSERLRSVLISAKWTLKARGRGRTANEWHPPTPEPEPTPEHVTATDLGSSVPTGLPTSEATAEKPSVQPTPKTAPTVTPALATDHSAQRARIARTGHCSQEELTRYWRLNQILSFPSTDPVQRALDKAEHTSIWNRPWDSSGPPPIQVDRGSFWDRPF